VNLEVLPLDRQQQNTWIGERIGPFVVDYEASVKKRSENR